MFHTLQTFIKAKFYPLKSSEIKNTHKITQLEVIGIGFPRTGTSTLKLALEILNIKTYHQTEAVRDKNKIKSWGNILIQKCEMKHEHET